MQKAKTKNTAADKQIGRNLRTMREAAQLTQKDLALVLQVTFQQLQKYETGKNRLPAARLYTLAQFFSVPYEEFFRGLGDCNDCGDCDYSGRPNDLLTAKLVHQLRAVDDPALKHRIGRMIDIMIDCPSSAGREDQ